MVNGSKQRRLRQLERTADGTDDGSDDIIGLIEVIGMPTFLENLKTACESHKSLLCVGLDPDPQRMPVSDVFQFNRAIIDATSDLVCAYKPNFAFYEAQGLDGLTALKSTVDHIRKVAPDVVVIGDSKRGDIDSSMKAYYKAMFEAWNLDAMTVSPYLGKDSIDPLSAYEGKGIFVLCRTSNKSAGDFQDVKALFNGQERPLYQHVALKSSQWNCAGNVGLVVGATYPKELELVRELCPDMPLLIPGVGAQGGSLEEVVRLGTDAKGRLAIINSSRQVLYASPDKDFPMAARREAMRLREAINDVLLQEGVGWS